MSPERLSSPLRRTLLLAAASQAALALGACSTDRQTPSAPFLPSPTALPRLRLIGQSRLAFGLQFKGTTVGGLSGLDYDPASGLWYALSDDGATLAPARFYTLRMDVSASGLGTPELVDAVTLRRPDGSPYPGSRQGGIGPDPEAIRFRPQTGTLLWTSEGDIRQGQDPAFYEARLDGTQLREFALPAMLKASRNPAEGPRHNLTFEGLTLIPDGSSAWVAMENALRQDGDIPRPGVAGGPCRFTQFDVATGRAMRQIAYMPDAVPRAPIAGGFADNGVSEILMLDAHRMLVLERAWMMGIGNSLRLYLIDTREASDTLGSPALAPGGFQPAAKSLLLDFSLCGLDRLDNTEAMTWGPRLPSRQGKPGHRTLVFASDDNFNPGQITQFLAFEFQEEE